jgi:glycerol-3-phosphate dehydrogenase (NAD+)
MLLEKVAIIGSGNWGSAISCIIGKNVLKFPDLFEPLATMWVYEETLPDGRLLSRTINSEHQNVKYLPGIDLPENIIAESDLVAAVKGASLLVFVTHHQFIRNICKQIKGSLDPRARGISLIKGVEVEPDCGLKLISEIIANELNIANEVAKEQFCESTLGYRLLENGQVFRKLLNAPHFRVALAKDVVGVEMCGALKNIIALGAGFVDGLGFGENTKATVVRIGLVEMKNFCRLFHNQVQESTFWESCGFADLLTTCYGGRNRKVAEEFVKSGKPIYQLEAEMLNGQKLQGPPTAKEIYSIVKEKNLSDEFPLLTSIYKICFEGLPPKDLIKNLEKQEY